MDSDVLIAIIKFMTTKQLTVLESQVSPVVAEAQALNITSTEQMTAASTLRERIKEVQKAIEADKEELYRPAKTVLDEINARYAPFEKPLKEALKIVNEKMSARQTAEIARAKAEADAIASRVGKGKGHLKPETAMDKIANIETPATLDLTGFTNRPKLSITDESLIPREYLVPNENAIELALKAGKIVPGAIMVDNYIPKSK